MTRVILTKEPGSSQAQCLYQKGSCKVEDRSVIHHVGELLKRQLDDLNVFPFLDETTPLPTRSLS